MVSTTAPASRIAHPASTDGVAGQAAHSVYQGGSSSGRTRSRLPSLFVDADGDRHVTTDASDQYVRRLLLSESGMTLEEVAQKANVPVGDVQRMASMLRKAETEGTAKTPAEAERTRQGQAQEEEEQLGEQKRSELRRRVA